MSLADQLLNLKRELAAATSPLQRMKMLARSWRSVSQLSPAERKQLSKAVGAEGLEGVLDRIAARKGRVGASFLVPSLAKFRDMDPDALGRLIEVLRDPEQRRKVLEKSASAVGDVLNETPAEEPETEYAIENQVDVEAEAAAETEAEAAVEIEIEAEVEDELAVEVETGLAGESEAEIGRPADSDDEREVEVAPADERDAESVEPLPPSPAIEERPRPTIAPTVPVDPAGKAEFESVRVAPTLGRRLALAREALDETRGWTAHRLRALLDVFPQDWARRRILVEMLKRGLVEDTSRAIDLIASLESRASRRWCVSLLLHQRELSDIERQAVSALY